MDFLISPSRISRDEKKGRKTSCKIGGKKLVGKLQTLTISMYRRRTGSIGVRKRKTRAIVVEHEIIFPTPAAGKTTTTIQLEV